MRSDRVPLPRSGGLAPRWRVLGVTTFGSFIANLDATIVVVALPRILVGLHTDFVAAMWTMTGYLLVSTVLLLPIGRLSDLVGRKRLYEAGFVLFALASALCGLSASGAQLVLFRLLQGVGGALLTSIATPLIAEAFPPGELGRALGINSVAWVLGSVVGPLAGGLLVGTFGWRSVFFVTVPFGLVAAVAAHRILPEFRRAAAQSPPERPTLRQALDPLGGGAFTVGVTAILLALSQGLDWGWASARLVGLYALGALALSGFVAAELRSRAPMFDLRLLGRTRFASAQLVGLFSSVGFFATTFLLTFYLQGVLGKSALEAGVLMIPLSLPQFITGPLGGWVGDRAGQGPPMLLGLALLVVAAVLLSRLGGHLIVGAVVVPLLLMATANGLYWPPLTSAVMRLVPRDRLGAGAGLFYTLRNLGFSLSLALALVFAEGSLPPATAAQVFLGTHVHLGHGAIRQLVVGIRVAFRFSALFFAAALLAALPLWRRIAGPTTESRR